MLNASLLAEAEDKDILSDNVLQRKQLTLKDIQEKTKAPYVHCSLHYISVHV